MSHYQIVARVATYAITCAAALLLAYLLSAHSGSAS